MSDNVHLFVNGSFTIEELAEALRPRFTEPFLRATEHDGSPYWSAPYEDQFTALGVNTYDGDAFDPERHPIVITFYGLRFPIEEEGDEWIERAWQQWLSWLKEAGASEVLMDRNFGRTLHHWRASDAGAPPSSG